MASKVSVSMCQAAFTITVGDVQDCFSKETTLHRRLLVEECEPKTAIAVKWCTGFQVELRFGSVTDRSLSARCVPLYGSRIVIHKFAVTVFDEKMEQLFEERINY